MPPYCINDKENCILLQLFMQSVFCWLEFDTSIFGENLKYRTEFNFYLIENIDGWLIERKKKFKIKFVVLNLTFYICSIQLALEGVAGNF